MTGTEVSQMIKSTDGLPITIFTPTYNRAHLLHRVYQSLCQQSFKDFEWIVVDDGSTDNTASLITVFSESSDFSIRYEYQPNSGKHFATNRGVSLAKGDLFAVLDSDDWFDPDAIKTILDEWQHIDETKRQDYSGLVFLYAYSSGKHDIVGTAFPRDILDSNAIEIRTVHGVKGDNFGVLRRDVLEENPFPEEFCGFVMESLIWNRLALRYKQRFVNKVVAYTEYQADGLSANGLQKRVESAPATVLRYKEYILCAETRYISPWGLLKAHVNYYRYQFHAGNLALFDAELPWHYSKLLAFPLAAFVWSFDYFKLKKRIT
ncbi:MAG: glycosyltransferase family A protein [Desulfuromonadales bacterium]|nr:glycosyltransferase family A protein [Desulfuromonadales bacterium]